MFNLNKKSKFKYRSTEFCSILSESCSFSVKTDKIIAVCGSIWAVAIILKNNSLQQNIEKKRTMNYFIFGTELHCEVTDRYLHLPPVH